jgi:NAD-dependent dihydropyrimidine dehydrogenase PreA subunit
MLCVERCPDFAIEVMRILHTQEDGAQL